MIIDSHEHLLLPTALQLAKMDEAGVDRAILFCTTPHPEKAHDLAELEAEMRTLNTILNGERSQERLQKNLAEVREVINAHPQRFLGFGTVPLGLSLSDTERWLAEEIFPHDFCGIGEFTPGDGQMHQLETVLQALSNMHILPIWVHTFHPVTLSGIHHLMALSEKYAPIPIIFGHFGGAYWLDVLKFAKTHDNIYIDLSASFTSIATKIALTELPERCLFSSDAPYGEPYLCRELIEFVSPSQRTSDMVLGENIAQLLELSS